MHLELVLHHVLGHKLNESFLEDHFLSFLFFDIFLEVVLHCFHLFEYFSHQINVTRWHLLHKRCWSQSILQGVHWHILSVEVGIGIGHHVRNELTIIRLLRKVAGEWLRKSVFGRRGGLLGVFIILQLSLGVWESFQGLFIFNDIISLNGRFWLELCSLWLISGVSSIVLPVILWFFIFGIVTIDPRKLFFSLSQHFSVNQLLIIDFIVLGKFLYLGGVFIVKNPPFLKVVSQLVGFHFHELHVWGWCWFFGDLFVIVHRWFAVWVYFFSHIQRWRLCWNLVLLARIVALSFVCTWFICVKCIFLFFYHLFLHFLPFFFDFFLLLKSSSVLPLLFLSFLFNVLFILDERVGVPILKSSFLADVLIVLLCGNLRWWCRTLVNVKIIVIMELPLEFFLFLLSDVLVLLVVDGVVVIDNSFLRSVSILTPEWVLVLSLLEF